jgi:hypothetical protein
VFEHKCGRPASNSSITLAYYFSFVYNYWFYKGVNGDISIDAYNAFWLGAHLFLTRGKLAGCPISVSGGNDFELI